MTGISASTGLVSGIDIGGLVTALDNANRVPVQRLQSRQNSFKSVEAGLTQLQATLLSLSSANTKLKSLTTFQGVGKQISTPDQFSATVRAGSAPGSVSLQTLQLAGSYKAVSKGFANADSQTIGTAGTLTIAQGDQISRPTRLDLFQSGSGVRRGTFRITDKSGGTADIDISNALNSDDVLKAISSASGIKVSAATIDGHFVITDQSGGSGALKIAELNGGSTAGDLGIAGQATNGPIVGSDILTVTRDFSLSLLNDGNGLRQKEGLDDLSFQLSDSTTFSVNLDGASTIGEVLDKINNDTDNGGKLTASLANGRIVLTDNAGGAGAVTATSTNQSNAAQVFGFSTTASGNVLTGQKLTAGIGSVLLRNLHGGNGISVPGSIQVTDRSGKSATIDLSQAESLDEVLFAISNAKTTGGDALSLKASVNDAGNGIVIRDSSGATAANLKIEDLAGGTTATNLGIAVDTSQTSFDSGSLDIRRVNESTSLDNYSPTGGRVASGSFRITNSAGQEAIINITGDTKNLGDVFDKINAAGIQVQASLNSKGDGFTLTDTSGGTQGLKIEELGGGKTAADLRLTGTATNNGSGQSTVTSHNSLQFDIAATDTLNSLVAKINGPGGKIKAAIVNTGATLTPFRISIGNTVTGESSQLSIDDGGTGLGFVTLNKGQDAVLRVGETVAGGFLVTSANNQFLNVGGTLDVTAISPGTTIGTVTTFQDTETIRSTVDSFVTAYNQLVTTTADLTKYDSATNTRGPLQGNSTSQRLLTRLSSLVNRITAGTDSPIRSLADAGVTLGTGGKLVFDQKKLLDAFSAHPDEIKKLFTDTTNGFGAAVDQVITGATDRNTGSLTAQINGIESTNAAIQVRIDQLNAIFDVKKQRLTQQFTNMENALAKIKNQSSSLTTLASIASYYQSTSTTG